ncbi:MAG TPA: hypothetical protein VGE29_06175 [Prosthecobacter sp.]
MAVKLSANYSKKLGLPQYSSHSFSASVEVELTDLSQAEAEIQKLYELLQHSVDQEIQQPGFVPQNEPPVQHRNPNRGLPSSHPRQNVGGGNGDRWGCTDGQRGFILRIVSDNNLDKQEAEDLSRQLFGTGVKQLNKMQASQLIEELLAKTGKPQQRQNRWQSQNRNTPSRAA